MLSAIQRHWLHLGEEKGREDFCGKNVRCEDLKKELKKELEDL